MILPECKLWDNGYGSPDSDGKYPSITEGDGQIGRLEGFRPRGGALRNVVQRGFPQVLSMKHTVKTPGIMDPPRGQVLHAQRDARCCLQATTTSAMSAPFSIPRGQMRRYNLVSTRGTHRFGCGRAIVIRALASCL